MQNYVSALLSNIAYLKDGNYSIRPDGSITLFGGLESELTQNEIDFFNDNFRITSQKNGSEGFSAMTIVAIKTSNFGGFTAGDVTLAYRGTEVALDDLNDIVTDIGMGLKALDEMIPDIIEDAVSIAVPVIGRLRAIANLPIWGKNFFESQTEQALSYFNEVKGIASNINVVGHSLGGFLANYVTTAGNNYTIINETTTFNAPGFSIAIQTTMKIKAMLDNLMLKDKSNLSSSELADLNDNIKILQDKITESTFNAYSFNKLNPYYSSSGIEFTSNELIMFSPVEKIPLFTTPQDIPIFDHKIALLMESTALYDSLNAIMKGSLIDNYKTITEMLEKFQKLPLTTTTTIKQITNYISTFLGFSSESSFDVFNFVSNLTASELNNYIYNPINSSNYKDSSSSLYALFNFIPFTIEGTDKITNEMYNPENYTSDHIESRFDLFNKIMSLKSSQGYQVNNSEIEQFKDYKIFFARDSATDFVYIDTYNNLMYTNDLSFYFNSGEIILKDDLKTIYFKNDNTLIVNTFKNIIYDYYGDDYIALNKGETDLYLSNGNDTVMIDVAAGATIKDLTIKDGGVGDLFIFNGGTGDDFIQGTKYNDKIIGGAGDDALFSGDGDDTINGGLGDDMIFGENGDDTLIGDDGNDYLMGGSGSNSLSGGNGNDTLNAYNTLNEYHDIRGDYLTGGSGTNTLFGTGYGDTYTYHGQENGIDTIQERDTHFGENYIDKLVFTSHTQSDEVLLYNVLNNLVITINGLERIFVIDYYDNHYSYLDEIQFTNIISGEKIIWNTQYILDYTISKKDGITTGTMGDDNLMGDDTNEKLYGNDGNDTIRGGKGDDIIYGGNGNDALYGEDGNDIIYGENGDDKLYGDAGDDIIYGGDGNDTINGGIGDDQLNGDAGNDIIFGGVGIDTISGGSGDDQLNGDAGNDLIYGGEGIDTINGGVDNDIIYGDNGDDKLYGDAGNDTIFGGEGNDNINGNIGDDNLDGNNGNDIINGGDGNDIINGGNHNDTLNGDAGNDVIYGGSGIDIINGGIGNDELHGGEGADTITGGLGNDNIYGDDGDDKLNSGGTGTSEFDKIYGGNGSDIISNDINNTYIRGGNDDDKIFTSGENIDIDGENGNDIIYISTGSGYIRGGNGDDTFINNGNPSSTNYTIEGGYGDDTINMTRGNHNIIYRQGDGNDKIIINGTNVISQTDSIRIHGYSKSSITSEKLFLLNNGKSLKIQLGENDSINLVDFLTSKTSIYNLNSFQFDDGILTSEDLIKIFTNIKGTTSNDDFYDTPFNDVFDMSGGGLDNVSLKSGFDTVYGGDLYTNINIYSANNIIYSGSGDDKLSLNGHYANTFNLKSFNNGADQIWIDSSSRSSKTVVNIQSNIYISDMILNVNSYFYTFSWNDNSSINFMKDYLNNQIILNSNGVAITDLTTLDLIGNNDGNYLKALSGRDQKIYGHGGRDTLRGNSGDDTIYGGTGDDNLDGDLGDDKIYGEEGGDTINDIYGSNRIWGGDGDDTINTGAGNDTIYGGNGVDTINAGSGIDTIYGGDGDDKIYGSGGFYYGEAGNDIYTISNGHIVDNSGDNTLNFGSDYRDNINIYKTGNGFNLSVSGINGVNNITYVGDIYRIERSYMLPDGYTYKRSLIDSQINKLFDLQAAMQSESDETKISEMRQEISNLWNYEKP